MNQYCQYVRLIFLHYFRDIETSSVHKSIEYPQQVSVQIDFRFTVHSVKVEPCQRFIKVGRHFKLCTIPETAIILCTVYVVNVIPKVRVLFQSCRYVRSKSSARYNSVHP